MGQDILKGYGMETQNRRITAQDMSSLPRYQSGGLVGKIKGIFSSGPEETVTQKYARQDAERAAKAAKAAPAPVAPAPAPAISTYAGNTALQAREKAAGLKKGGAVRGPGTGTSDDVPIMASNGEFMIKASAVKKIGIEALEALNAIGDKKGAGKKDGMPAMKKGGAIRCMASGGFVGAKDSEEYNKAMQRDQSKTGFFSRTPSSSAPTPSDPSKTGYFSRNPSQPTQSLPATTPEEAQARAASIAQAYAAQGAPVPGATQRQLVPGAIPTAATTAQSPASPQAATSPASPFAGTPSPMGSQINPDAPSLRGRPGADVAGAPGVSKFVENGKTLYSNVAGDNAYMMDKKLVGIVPGGAVRALGSYGGGADGGEALQAARMAAVERGDIESVRATYGGNFGGKTAADYQTDPALGAIRKLANGPMTARRAAALSQLQAGLGQTIAGQGQAANSAAANQLARDKFGVDSKSAGIDQEVKSNMLAAQKVMADPNATPAQKAAAEENYRAWQGKYAKEAAPDKYNHGQIGTGPDGTPVFGTYSERTGLPPQGQKPATPTAMPAVGEVRNGFKFKGGNPNDKASWVKNG